MWWKPSYHSRHSETLIRGLSDTLTSDNQLTPAALRALRFAEDSRTVKCYGPLKCRNYLEEIQKKLHLHGPTPDCMSPKSISSHFLYLPHPLCKPRKKNFALSRDLDAPLSYRIKIERKCVRPSVIFSWEWIKSKSTSLTGSKGQAAKERARSRQSSQQRQEEEMLFDNEKTICCKSWRQTTGKVLCRNWCNTSTWQVVTEHAKFLYCCESWCWERLDR